MKLHLSIWIGYTCLLVRVTADNCSEMKTVVQNLVNRVDQLEAETSAQKKEIDQLKQDRDYFKKFAEATGPHIKLMDNHVDTLYGYINDATELFAKKMKSDEMEQDVSQLGKADHANRHPDDTFPKRQVNSQNRVAFFATLTPHDHTHLGIGQNLLFDNALTNIGNSYHPSQGVFIAPTDGVYVFFSTIAGQKGDAEGVNYASFDIKGTTVARLLGRHSEQASQMIIADLKANDEVSVQSDRVDSSFLGAEFASFSGFLLYSNSDTEIVGK